MGEFDTRFSLFLPQHFGGSNTESIGVCPENVKISKAKKRKIFDDFVSKCYGLMEKPKTGRRILLGIPNYQESSELSGTFAPEGFQLFDVYGTCKRPLHFSFSIYALGGNRAIPCVVNPHDCMGSFLTRVI